jgi:predicted transcriptional regulator
MSGIKFKHQGFIKREKELDEEQKELVKRIKEEKEEEQEEMVEDVRPGSFISEDPKGTSVKTVQMIIQMLPY